MSSMKTNPIKILRVIVGVAIVLLWLCLLMLTGCKTCDCLPSVEYRDSVVTRYRHDTIQTYEKDSVYIHAKGDTVWRERWSVRYRDKIVERHDTIYCDREKETVRVERVVPTYYKGVSMAFWVLVVLLLVATAIRVLIRAYLKR